jgi:DNA-binding CsgD family transcriptional regulator
MPDLVYRSFDQRAQRGDPLTILEIDALARVASGHTDEQIARTLTVSLRTVRRRLTAAQKKLGARNRPQAVVLAIQAGLFRIDPAGITVETTDPVALARRASDAATARDRRLKRREAAS